MSDQSSMAVVLHSYAYSLDYLREQVADLSPVQMLMQPHGMLSHPAWVIGHLTYSCQAIGGEFGLAEWLPSDWRQLYGTGSRPMAEASHYPPKDEALLYLSDGQRRVTAAVRALSDNQLDQPLPDENYRRVLPTIRHAITQVLVAHVAYHVGQVTLWRRLNALPSLARPFA